MLFDRRQTGIRRTVFYRRCRMVLQMWASYEDGIEEMIFERCAVDARVFSPPPAAGPVTRRVYPAWFLGDRNRGRHWDRKRK